MTPESTATWECAATPESAATSGDRGAANGERSKHRAQQMESAVNGERGKWIESALIFLFTFKVVEDEFSEVLEENVSLNYHSLKSIVKASEVLKKRFPSLSEVCPF